MVRHHPDTAQGGVIGHSIVSCKSGNLPQGQEIASCASRCCAQCRCLRNSQSKTCGKSGPVGCTRGRIFRRKMEHTAFRGTCQILPHTGAFAAARKRSAPDSGAVDRTKATCSSAVPASGQDSWTPPPRQSLIACTSLCLAWRLFQRAVMGHGGLHVDSWCLTAR